MLQLKPGCRIADVKPELLLGLLIVYEVFRRKGFDMTVTEVTGAKHMEHSLHYKGLAADIRSKNIDSEQVKVDILMESREALGEDFDMILEYPGSESEHFHLEMDSK